MLIFFHLLGIFFVSYVSALFTKLMVLKWFPLQFQRATFHSSCNFQNVILESNHTFSKENCTSILFHSLYRFSSLSSLFRHIFCWSPFFIGKFLNWIILCVCVFSHRKWPKVIEFCRFNSRVFGISAKVRRKLGVSSPLYWFQIELFPSLSICLSPSVALCTYSIYSDGAHYA